MVVSGMAKHGPLGRDAIAARAGNADAAAHRHSVHERDAGLGVGIFEVVEAIFVEEEGARRGFVPVDVLRDADDVAAGAEAAAFGMIDQDDADVGIVAPFDQRVGHVANHLAVEAVERLGPVEAEAAGEALLERQHVLLRRSSHPSRHHRVAAGRGFEPVRDRARRDLLAVAVAVEPFGPVRPPAALVPGRAGEPVLGASRARASLVQ